MTSIQNDKIPNDISNLLYLKTLEPGFDYEAAINDGGLAMRELFNAVVLILNNLKEDNNRLPIQKLNVFVAVDGNLSSYTALDAAVHIFKTGSLNIVATINKGNMSQYNSNNNMATSYQPSTEILSSYLSKDLLRRCKMQYQLLDWSYNVQTLIVDDTNQLRDDMQTLLVDTCADIIVIGMDNSNIGSDSDSIILLYFTWICPIPVLLAKPLARTRMFSAVNSPKTIQVCIKSNDDVDYVFTKAKAFIRPGDTLILVCIVPDRDAIGDTRDTRYGIGSRTNVWMKTTAYESYPHGWNDASVNECIEYMHNLLKLGQLNGKVRVERLSKLISVSKHLCNIAFEESVDIMLMWNRKNKDVIQECAIETTCSLLIIK